MSSPYLGACEGFVWELSRSGLVDRGQLDQLVGDYLKVRTQPTPEDMAKHLVEQRVLTPFQSECVLAGKGQDLVLNPYVLIDAIGAGSMGTVFKASSKNDKQIYAVKLVPRRSMWNVRVARRVVRSFEGCRHPAVVPFTDVGTAGGFHFLVWKLVEGEPLDRVVQRKGKLLPGVAALYGLLTVVGLDAIHKQNLIHGLLKPSNLMITKEQRVLILDAGIGALLAESGDDSLVDTMSTANTVTTGLDCRSPENILNPALRTPAGDQYSLGCVLYYCLTGRFPFPEGTAVQKMMAHQTQEPPPIRQFCPQAPPALDAVIQKLMRKKPEERYASVDEVVLALRPLAVTPQVAAKLVGSASPAPTPATAATPSAPKPAAVAPAAPAAAAKPVAPAPAGARPAAVATPSTPPRPAPPTLHGVPKPAAQPSRPGGVIPAPPVPPPTPPRKPAPATLHGVPIPRSVSATMHGVPLADANKRSVSATMHGEPMLNVPEIPTTPAGVAAAAKAATAPTAPAAVKTPTIPVPTPAKAPAPVASSSPPIESLLAADEVPLAAPVAADDIPMADVQDGSGEEPAAKRFEEPRLTQAFRMSDLVDRNRPHTAKEPKPLPMGLIVGLGAACFLVGALVLGGIIWLIAR